MGNIPEEDKLLKEEQDKKPPRYMVALVDFKTDVQIHVGAPVIEDFLKPLPAKEQRDLSEQVRHVFVKYNQRRITTKQAHAEIMDLMAIRERFELERVIRYFERKVRESERKAKAAFKKKPKRRGGQSGGKSRGSTK